MIRRWPIVVFSPSSPHHKGVQQGDGRAARRQQAAQQRQQVECGHLVRAAGDALVLAEHTEVHGSRHTEDDACAKQRAQKGYHKPDILCDQRHARGGGHQGQRHRGPGLVVGVDAGGGVAQLFKEALLVLGLGRGAVALEDTHKGPPEGDEGKGVGGEDGHAGGRPSQGAQLVGRPVVVVEDQPLAVHAEGAEAGEHDEDVQRAGQRVGRAHHRGEPGEAAALQLVVELHPVGVRHVGGGEHVDEHGAAQAQGERAAHVGQRRLHRVAQADQELAGGRGVGAVPQAQAHEGG
eukprot:CAMPEP_0206413276 /NCGR_PEP_ID=MMETSP0294-20121207/34555_1 /ASSEMBLY_ACC=CAM_ASM_000327 /TAXON_ID=39354 /ORGANISM="Heterosigma akashiwo, Strain CCMP2393" /LENGTH=291 /DNA_ID=CAMNT_0053874709 /DNA_START=264 /DNA_END=1135 /DNA_ORIENTATION=+